MAVFLCSRTPDAVAETVKDRQGQGFMVDGYSCDVRSPEQIKGFARREPSTVRPDVLVSNAGGMLKRKRGRIISIASTGGKQGACTQGLRRLGNY
jgi:ketoreductase